MSPEFEEVEALSEFLFEVIGHWAGHEDAYGVHEVNVEEDE